MAQELNQEQNQWEQATDGECFARVWKRVVQSEGDNSPIELVAPPSPAPAEPVSADPLGDGSAKYGSFLCQSIREELTDWRTYRALAGGGRGRSVLLALAGQELDHAKRLSAAYFLITGVRFLPREQAPAGRWPQMELGLREMFRREQRQERIYLQAAEETEDTALRELYRELGREEAIHAGRIRRLLEE